MPSSSSSPPLTSSSSPKKFVFFFNHFHPSPLPSANEGVEGVGATRLHSGLSSLDDPVVIDRFM
ncbi:hypothetical protein ACHAXS_013795 [Conticribra weissflogii]